MVRPASAPQIDPDGVDGGVSDPCDRAQHVLSRELLRSGGIAALLAREQPALRLLDDAERAASLQATLAQRPAGDAWLFAYGSLIWNPTVRCVERRVARIRGWQRAFCLSVEVARGSSECPGLMLGLDAGGECTGVAYRLDECDLHAELELLWRREMVAEGYIPRWVDLFDDAGARFGGAIAFTMDTGCAQYAGDLCEDEVVRRLATARGSLGSAAEYLFRTCESLRACGLADPDLERLACAVGRRMEACGASGG